MFFGVHIRTLQIIDFQVVIQNSNSSTFYSMADVIKISFHKEKFKCFGKKLTVFIKTSRIYVLVHLQYYQNERLDSTTGRDAFLFAL